MDARKQATKPVGREAFIELLNVDLSLEYMAIVQYIQHSGVIKGAVSVAIRREMARIAAEELRHALTLSEQIDRLGGVPTVKVIKARTSGKSVTMLRQDLKGEEDAVCRYQSRIGQADELGLLELGQRLREILAMEQEHAACLREALEKEEIA